MLVLGQALPTPTFLVTWGKQCGTQCSQTLLSTLYCKGEDVASYTTSHPCSCPQNPGDRVLVSNHPPPAQRHPSLRSQKDFPNPRTLSGHCTHFSGRVSTPRHY